MNNSVTSGSSTRADDGNVEHESARVRKLQENSAGDRGGFAAGGESAARLDDNAAAAADEAADRAVTFALAGKYDEALTEARSAVDGYRALAAEEPDVYRPDLAAALDSLASRAGDVGRNGDAAAAAHEAVELFRELAGPALDRVRAGAGSATDSAASGAGQSDATRHAVDQQGLQRGLDEDENDDSALFIPYLAAATSNLSVRLHNAGADSQALEAAREAAALFQDLAGGSPAAAPPSANGGASTGPGWQPGQLLPEDGSAARTPPPLGEHSAGLAMALSNLANRLDEAHQLSEALDVSEQAAAVYQQLIVADPDRFRPLLAQIMNNRAVLLREAGKTAVAISTTRQAVNVYRSLVATKPEIYRDYLAMVLGNLANMLTEAGRGRDALGIAHEATALYRQLADDADAASDTDSAIGTDPQPGGLTPPSAPDNPYHAPLAMSLNNLAVLLADASRADEALAATKEASGIYRRLSRRNPQLHLGNLAGTLTNLGADLAQAGQPTEALAATREAVDVTRRLAFGNRPVYLPQLAQAVNNLAVRLHEAERDSSAMASARESLRLYEELAAKDPDQYADATERTRELITFLAAH